jgi:zinc protease
MPLPATVVRGARVAVAALAGTLLGLAVVSASATNIQRVVSPGGIEFWLVQDATVPLIALDFAFRGGTAQDPQDKPGVANFTMSMLDEGAGELDSKAYHDRLERNAIELRFSANRDYVRGTMRTLKDKRDEAFNLLRLALNAPHFDATALERVRAQIVSLLERQSTNPNSVASREWWRTAFPDHPYGRQRDGTLDGIKRVTADDLRAFQRANFARDNLKIGVVGDIDGTAAGRLIDSTFGALPAKAELRPVADVKPQGLGRQIVVDLDVPQAVVMFGGTGIGRHDPDFMAAYIVNHILGGGAFSSRLYREVREKRGLAYGVRNTLIWFRHAAIMLGSTATRADATAQSLNVIEDQIRLMATQGPTQEELDAAKTYLIGSFALSLDTSTKISSQLVSMQLDNLGIDYIQRRSALINAVTLDDAKRVAKRLLDGGLLVTVAGRPKGLTSKGPRG